MPSPRQLRGVPPRPALYSLPCPYATLRCLADHLPMVPAHQQRFMPCTAYGKATQARHNIIGQRYRNVRLGLRATPLAAQRYHDPPCVGLIVSDGGSGHLIKPGSGCRQHQH